MTASDACMNYAILHSILDKSEVYKDDLETAHMIIANQRMIIESLWFLMIEFDKTIGELQKREELDPPINNAAIKMLQIVRNLMAEKFNEKDYFKGMI